MNISNSSITPLTYYREQVKSGQISADPQQLMVVEKLQSIHNALIAQSNKPELFKFLQKSKPIKGLYLWGSVGSGKTLLIDLFFHCLPFENKLRIHFHKFMQQIHEQLTTLQGKPNPLKIVAKSLAAKFRIIFLDELMVNNIVDAMLLGELFKALLGQGISLIFTSNTAPDNLYKNGLQRQRFLPVIELIKTYTEVIHLETHTDYRLQYAANANFYWTPLDQISQQKMEESFLFFSKQKEFSSEPLQVHNRPISVIKRANGVAWFDFLKICGIPRSQADYLMLTENFHTIMISNIIPIKPEQYDLIETFIKLIDVLYDEKKRLIISAAVPIHDIYSQGRMSFEFARTRSRLIEMQSEDWII